LFPARFQKGEKTAGKRNEDGSWRMLKGFFRRRKGMFSGDFGGWCASNEGMNRKEACNMNDGIPTGAKARLILGFECTG
jgi:hypothetical protein